MMVRLQLCLLGALLILTTGSRALEWDYEFENHQYFITKDMYSRLNWYKSRAECMAEGGDLITIETLAEDEWIEKQSVPYNGNLWIGLNNLKRGEKWEWADGKSTDVDNWSDPPGATELCAYRSSTTSRVWYSENCSQYKGFICKRQKGVITPKTTPSTTVVGGYCPLGWTDPGTDRCYKIFGPLDTKMKWDEAHVKCSSLGYWKADLACANVESEISALTMMVATRPKSEELWFGLYRNYNVQQTWKWTDNTLVSVEYFHEGYTEEDKGCGFISSRLEPAGSWDTDGNCKSSKFSYICQIWKNHDNFISTPGPTVPSGCDPGYMAYGNGCYKLIEKLKSYAEAREYCELEKSTLVDIHSAGENAAVQFMMSESADIHFVWIGLEYDEEDQEYEWSNGWYVNYVRWGPGQPKSEQGCVAMETATGLWFATNCSKPQPFVCKITTDAPITEPPPKEGRCPNKQWSSFGGHCYYVCPDCDLRNWFDQLNECRGAYPTAKLASIHDKATNHKVYQRLVDGGILRGAWLGLHVSKTTGQWAWEDGTQVQFTNWALGEPPDDPSSIKTCAFMSSKMADHGTWKTAKCTSLMKGGLCQTDKIGNLTTPSPAPGVCPSDEWYKYGGHCYLFRPDHYLNWNQANEICIQDGHPDAHLATIYDWSENNFIHSSMLNITERPVNMNFWIGLSKTEELGSYTWLDGQKLEGFIHWEPGQPTDGLGKDCVQFNILSSMWLNEKCDALSGYVCKVHVMSGPDNGSVTSYANPLLIALTLHVALAGRV